MVSFLLPPRLLFFFLFFFPRCVVIDVREWVFCFLFVCILFFSVPKIKQKIKIRVPARQAFLFVIYLSLFLFYYSWFMSRSLLLLCLLSLLAPRSCKTSQPSLHAVLAVSFKRAGVLRWQVSCDRYPLALSVGRLVGWVHLRERRVGDWRENLTGSRLRNVYFLSDDTASLVAFSEGGGNDAWPLLFFKRRSTATIAKWILLIGSAVPQVKNNASEWEVVPAFQRCFFCLHYF